MNISGWSRGLEATGAGLGDHPLIATCDNTGERLPKPLPVRVEEHFQHEHFRLVTGPLLAWLRLLALSGDLAEAERRALVARTARH
jgi:hypothetical protein